MTQMKTKLAIRVLTARVWSRSSDAAKESAQFLNVQSALRCFSFLSFDLILFMFFFPWRWCPSARSTSASSATTSASDVAGTRSYQAALNAGENICNFHYIWTGRVWYLWQVMILVIWPKCEMVAPSRFPLPPYITVCKGSTFTTLIFRVINVESYICGLA